MTELMIKPVRYGVIIGLLGLLLGIGWAFWLVLGHERIHKSLEKSVVEKKEVHSLIDILEPDNAQANTTAKGVQNEHSHGQPSNNEDTHRHEEEGKPLQKDEHMDMMNKGQQMMQTGEDKHQHGEGMHDNPIMELAHKRLVRGHLHLMGLGLVSAVLSLILGFTSAPPLFKTVASVLTGIGGIIYPVAWIVMGYMTPALGPDGAEASVMAIAGIGVALVLLGIFTTIAFLLKDIFKKAAVTEQRI
ncbi:MAG: hypothetical protein Q7T53_11095 [Deltaproteobacteria bacterium]|nr:hypothetical protein [Deltaproteobacteria bacterium]